MTDWFPLPYYCSYEERCSNQNCCIHSAINKNIVEQWNDYCSNCPFGNNNIGIFLVVAGNPKKYLFSKNFSQKKEYIFHCKQQSDAEYAMQYVNSNAENFCFSWGLIENFAFLEKFSNLKYLRFSSSKVTHLSWDLTKTSKLEYLSIEGKHLSDLSGLEKAENLHVFEFTIATSRTDRQEIKSLEPLSHLFNLESVLVQGARLQDANIEHLISIPNLKELYVSPDTYSIADFAKFEAKKFKINETYGCYFKDEEYFWKYGNDSNPMRLKLDKQEKIDEYLKQYTLLMEKYQ